MARDGQVEVDLLAGGMSMKAPTKGAYTQNLLMVNNAWEVRSGFGQVAQIDTTLSHMDATLSGQGLVWHLGSRTIVTDQRHVQHISVFRSRSRSSDFTDNGQWVDHVTVIIYDMTTGARWEEPLVRHTSESSKHVQPVTMWRGHYETSRLRTLEAWTGQSDSNVFFAKWQDHLVFGNRDIGMWAYTPCDFLAGRPRHRQTDAVNDHVWHPPYGESSVVTRIAAVDGVYSTLNYLKSSEYPSFPAAAAAIIGRLAIAQQRDVFFSDAENPCSVQDANVITIPSEREITALAVAGDALLIFTPDEVWHYLPNQGQVVSKGRLVRIGHGIGCLSPSSLCNVETAVLWVDPRRVCICSGGLEIQTLSDDVEPFFLDAITNPLTHYFVAAGTTTLAGEQPRLTYALPTTENVSCAYDPVRGYAHIAVPDLNAILSYHLATAAWSLQLLESTVSGTVGSPTPNTVGAQRQLLNPWVTEADHRVFLTAGPELHLFDDDAIDGLTRVPLVNNGRTNSFIICELGRGGGLDRSVDALEDNRAFCGQYTKFDNAGTPTGAFYLEKPVICPANYTFPGGIAGVAGFPNGRVRSNVVLVPVYLVPDAAAASDVDQLHLVFYFDNVHWRRSEERRVGKECRSRWSPYH